MMWGILIFYGEDKKAISGTGGNFSFYELGAPIFLPCSSR